MDTLTLNLPNTVGLTDEQFYQLCVANEQWRFELSKEGELIIKSPLCSEYYSTRSELVDELLNWNHYKKVGFVFPGATVFRLQEGIYRSPDISWILRERWEALSSDEKRRFPQICPDFVVEIRTPDLCLEKLQTKMTEYIANGVRLGWLIDLESAMVEIYRVESEIELLNFPADKGLTLWGEDVLPGFVVDFSPIAYSQ
jgi:Uma2 family endonuclease